MHTYLVDITLVLANIDQYPSQFLADYDTAVHMLGERLGLHLVGRWDPKPSDGQEGMWRLLGNVRAVEAGSIFQQVSVAKNQFLQEASLWGNTSTIASMSVRDTVYGPLETLPPPPQELVEPVPTPSDFPNITSIGSEEPARA